MKKYKITVEKLQKINGTVEIEADNVDEAFAIITKNIESGELQTTDCSWEEEYPDYVDDSFKATGDVEDIGGDRDFEVGDEVFWTAPDGSYSEYGKVIEVRWNDQEMFFSYLIRLKNGDDIRALRQELS